MPDLKITPCLWYDRQAEEAAKLYTRVFPNSAIDRITRFPDVGQEIHGGAAGSVMTVEFHLDGKPFTALNGGPLFKFSEAVSFQVFCADQQELDHYWNALGEGGDPAARQCGWLKDRFGLSWQIVPEPMERWMAASPEAVMGVMLEMKKLDFAALEKASRR